MPYQLIMKFAIHHFFYFKPSNLYCFIFFRWMIIAVRCLQNLTCVTYLMNWKCFFHPPPIHFKLQCSHILFVVGKVDCRLPMYQQLAVYVINHCYFSFPSTGTLKYGQTQHSLSRLAISLPHVLA